MLLVIDVGNTHTVLGVFDRVAHRPGEDVTTDPPRYERLVANWRVGSHLNRTVDEYGVIFRNLFSMDNLEVSDVHGIAISSVVPPLDSVLRQVCERYFNIKPLSIEPGVKTGMQVLYDNPAEVGADRIVNAVAAFEKYGGPCVIVDFGTATTFDCIARDGAYVGGAITPGLELGLEALASRTARLPRIELVEPPKAIGTDTVSAMQSGIVLGYRALTLGLIERIKAELARAEKVDGSKIQVVLTGGLSAGPWARELPGVDAIDPELTLKGLAILWAVANGEPSGPGDDTIGWTGSAAGSIHVISEPDA